MSKDLVDEMKEIMTPHRVGTEKLRTKYALVEPFLSDSKPLNAAQRVLTARDMEPMEDLLAEGLIDLGGGESRDDLPCALADLMDHAKGRVHAECMEELLIKHGLTNENWHGHNAEKYAEIKGWLDAQPKKGSKTVADMADERKGSLKPAIKEVDKPREATDPAWVMEDDPLDMMAGLIDADVSYADRTSPDWEAMEAIARKLEPEHEMTDSEIANILEVPVEKLLAFKIDDKAKAEWYINLVAGTFGEVDRIAEMAVAMINDRLRAVGALQRRHDPDFRKIALEQLEKKKDGTYKKKNWRTLLGGVYFTKTGGIKLHDREMLQEWIDNMPESECAKYGITTKRVCDLRDLKKRLAEMPGSKLPPGYGMIPENPVGKWGIGTTRAWTIGHLSRILKKVKQFAEGPEDDDDEE